MQILASALPGFRDLRAPLTAGYLWLVFAWVAIKPDIGTRPTNDVARALYDLGESVGPFWIGLGVSVAAYLIGSVSQALSPLLEGLASGIYSRFYKQFGSAVSADEIANSPMHEVDPILQFQRTFTASFDALMNSDAALSYVHGSLDDHRENVYKELDDRVSAARRGLEYELDMPATLLLGNEPQLFAEADRLKAEGQLRLAVIPPLTAITIELTTATGSCWWLVGFLAIAVLAFQGSARIREFRSLMRSAVRRGLIDSKSIENLTDWGKAQLVPVR